MEKEFFGNDLEEALARAQGQLGIAREDLRYRVLELRLGNKLKISKIAIIVEVDEAVAVRPRQQDAGIWQEMEPLEKIQYFLVGLFAHLHIEAKVRLIEKPDAYIAAIDLQDSDLDTKKGDAREFRGALQHLVSRVISTTTSMKKVVVDIGGILEKREEVLTEWSAELAALIERGKKKLFIYLMDSQDRRLLHNALKDNANIQTEGLGDPTYRVFCIEPVRE